MIEKQKRLSQFNPWLHKYNLFVKAKNLGINFGLKDFTIEDINIFSIISNHIEEIARPKDEKINSMSRGKK